MRIENAEERHFYADYYIDKRIYQYACEWLEKVKNDM